MQRMTDVGGAVHEGDAAWMVGIDLGRRAAHEAVLRGADGSERGLRFTHSREGIDGFVGELSGLDGRVLVIIEPTATRWQALAEELSCEGIEVRQVHAATVAKLRGARDITGAKSDRVDARTLAGAVGYSHPVRPDPPALACAHALCLERLRLRRERRRLRGSVKICLDTIWPEFLQTFRGGERGVTARAVMAVTGGDPARARRLGAQELERRVRMAAPGRHIGHTKIKQLVQRTSRPVGYRAARTAYAARLAATDATPHPRREATRRARGGTPGPLPSAARRRQAAQPSRPATDRQGAAARRRWRHSQTALPPSARQARRLCPHRSRLRQVHAATQDLRALPLPVARRGIPSHEIPRQSVPRLPSALSRTAPTPHGHTSTHRVRQPTAARDLANG